VICVVRENRRNSGVRSVVHVHLTKTCCQIVTMMMIEVTEFRQPVPGDHHESAIVGAGAPSRGVGVPEETEVNAMTAAGDHPLLESAAAVDPLIGMRGLQGEDQESLGTTQMTTTAGEHLVAGAVVAGAAELAGIMLLMGPSVHHSLRESTQGATVYRGFSQHEDNWCNRVKGMYLQLKYNSSWIMHSFMVSHELEGIDTKALWRILFYKHLSGVVLLLKKKLECTANLFFGERAIF